jgi:single-stranded-DNA-specific exonuclease
MAEVAKREAKIWQLLPHDAQAIERLSREVRVAPIVAQLLLNRRLGAPDVARHFLDAPLAGLCEPERLPGVPQAVERLWAAIQEKRRVCVYGDYDVDGVTATAILLTCLKHLGAQAEFHVPHRLEDGYGLSKETLQKLAEAGVQTVVTVDCGIASVAEAEEAHRLGLELIITDHHEPKATLPRAAAIVHPRLPGLDGEVYPCGALSGSGVAFKLAWALCKRACGSAKVTAPLREFLLDAILLAALGTVADVVPLFDENRIFVRHGLARLRARPSLGLQALLKQAKLDTKVNLGAGDIGYSLAPRLNAAGRLGTARLAVELLMTPNAERAGALADFLERQNHERQSIERRITQEARLLAEREGNAPALVLASADWHPGLIGIVASRLVEQYASPMLMIAMREDQPHGQGSGRSLAGFKLHEALQECAVHLVSHGGHASAAGFRIVREAIGDFRATFSSVAGRHFATAPAAPRLVLDAEVPLAALTLGLLEGLDRLEPYGAGNPQPLLLADRLQVVGTPRRVGKGELHLSFRVRQNGKEVRCIAFGMGNRLDELMSAAGQCCLAFTPQRNEWQGYRSVDLHVRDFQAGAEARLE